MKGAIRPGGTVDDPLPPGCACEALLLDRGQRIVLGRRSGLGAREVDIGLRIAGLRHGVLFRCRRGVQPGRDAVPVGEGEPEALGDRIFASMHNEGQGFGCAYGLPPARIEIGWGHGDVVLPAVSVGIARLGGRLSKPVDGGVPTLVAPQDVRPKRGLEVAGGRDVTLPRRRAAAPAEADPPCGVAVALDDGLDLSARRLIDLDAGQGLVPVARAEFDRRRRQAEAPCRCGGQQGVREEVSETRVIAAAFMRLVDDDEVERAEPKADRVLEQAARRAAPFVVRAVIGGPPRGLFAESREALPDGLLGESAQQAVIERAASRTQRSARPDIAMNPCG